MTLFSLKFNLDVVSINGTKDNLLFLPDLGLQLCSNLKLNEFYSNLTLNLIIVSNFLKLFYKFFTSPFSFFQRF